MNRFFTLLFSASCLTAFGQVPDYVPTDGLIGWWAMDGNALDASENGHDGNMQGTTPSNDRFGNPSGCLNFTEGDVITIPSLTSHTPVFSVTFWLELDEYFSSASTYGYNHFFNKWSGIPTSFVLSANIEGLYIYSGSQLYQSNVLPPLNEWHHIGFVVNPPTAAIFINGVQVYSFEDEAVVAVPPLDTQCVQIGGNDIVGDYTSVDGSMDDLGFWGRPLTGLEMAEVYELSNVEGCTDQVACNYDSDANLDDGSCHFLCQYCKEGTVWDEDIQGCIVANPSDSNFDGCVQLNDLLDLLSAYGDCDAEESAWQCGDPLEYQGYDYETVQIGEQCWFAENLRAENYRNGEAIPAGLSDSEWENTTSGAVAVYGEDEGCSNASPDIDACAPEQGLEEYGRLYNWYAVDNSRGLCPSGWHIPSNGEWTMMTNELGDESIAGVKMKTTYGWSNNGNGTNSSSFSGLPGGSRFSNDGYFGGAGDIGYWWSSSPNGSYGWFRTLVYNQEIAANSSVGNLRSGFSVRCIKD